jgi:phosphatidylserine/phosphatidylglycerophosphate/cardiolipin synthase-like enzyme
VFVFAACAPSAPHGGGDGDAATRGDAATGDGARGHDGEMQVDAGLPGSTDVHIIVEPNGNHASELLSAIEGAHASVYMTMYQIDNTSIVSALVGRKHAGLDVQAVLDGSTTNQAWNTPAYNALHAAGVDVVWSSPSFTYTHEKTVIIDGTQAWIMTMNANQSPPTSNREYLAIDGDPDDVAEATAVFQADHAMHSIAPTGNLVVANANARQKLVALIDSATSTLDVEVEELSDLNLSGVVNAIAQTAHRGVNVRVVLANGSATSTQTQAVHEIQQAGAHVVVTGPTSSGGTSSNPYIHAKAVVVDCAGTTCARGFVGSENFSGGSLGYNRELGVIYTDQAELAKVEAAFAGDFARGVAQ